jgi:hypothetical protein
MTWQLGVVLFLPPEESLEVFNPAKHEDGNRANDADGEHAFENPYKNRDDQTHNQTMLFEIAEVEQREAARI